MYKLLSKSKILWIVLIVLLIPLVFLWLYWANVKSPKLNLIVISVDTLRADHLNLYGYKRETAPNITKWAENAFVFTNYYSPIPVTYPAIASIMTGKHPLSLKIFTNGLGPNINLKNPTLAELLKKQGYQTGAFVTNRFINQHFTNLDRGFDNFNFFDAFGNWKKNRLAYDQYLKLGLEWLEKNQNQKYFMWIHLMDPHYIYFPPEENRCLGNICLQSNYQEIKEQFYDYRGCDKSQSITNSIVTNQVLAYDGEIKRADSIVGVYLNKLKELGLDKNTVVVILGDHGESFDHHYYFEHGDLLYESSIKVPLIIKYPTIDSELQFYNNLIDHSDITPTVLDLLKINYSADTFDGISFTSLIKKRRFFKENLPIKQNVYLSNSDLSQFGIISGQYKYLFSSRAFCNKQKGQEELYNLSRDKKEANNLINSIDQLQTLHFQLIDFLDEKNVSNFEVKNFIDPKIKKQLEELGY